MKKIIELEGRWKTYKYKYYIFYIFIFVFFIFLIFVGLFVKSQYQKHNVKNDLTRQDIRKSQSNSTIMLVTGNINNTTNVESNTNGNSNINLDSSANVLYSYPSINFICRKVTSNKLMVRNGPSFKSKPVGRDRKSVV